jgi:hypothetical protein
MASWCAKNMTASHRVSVRLSDGQMEGLEACCRETGRTVTDIVREALEGFLASKSGSKPNNGPPKRLSPPEAIFVHIGAYLAAGGRDLRKERNELYLQLLTLSFACVQLYPRTRNMAEGYEDLLQLCHQFGVD